MKITKMKKQILLTIFILITVGGIVSSYHPGTQQANTQTQKTIPQPPSTGSTVIVIAIMLLILVGFVILASKQANKKNK